MRAFRALYGAHPLHLLALLGCLALSGVAAVHLSHSPQALRVLVWFAGAVVAHDLVLYPLYMLADRGLQTRRRAPGSVNWVRVPALLSGLLLLLFWPVITQHSEASYSYASGLGQDVFLTRYLLVTAALFLGSAVLFALTRGRRRG